MCVCVCVESLVTFHNMCVCMWVGGKFSNLSQCGYMEGGRGSLLNAVGGESSEKMELDPYN